VCVCVCKEEEAGGSGCHDWNEGDDIFCAFLKVVSVEFIPHIVRVGLFAVSRMSQCSKMTIR
jgi:hypothetical protein